MDKLHSAVLYVSAHWGAILESITILLSIVGTVRNALTHKSKTEIEVDTGLGYLVDVLAFVSKYGQRGIVGALSLPLWPSMPKVAKPPVPPAKGSALLSVVIAIAAIGLFAFSLGGCGTAGGQALGKCELGAMPQQAEAVIAAVAAVLSNTSDINWVGDLEALGIKAGPSLVDCTVAAITAAASAQMPAHGQPEPMLLTTIQRGQIWAKAHPAKCCAK